MAKSSNKILNEVETVAETIWIKALLPIAHNGEMLAMDVVHEVEKLAGEAWIKLGFAVRAVPPAPTEAETDPAPADAPKADAPNDDAAKSTTA